MKPVIPPTIGRRVLLFIASTSTPGVTVANPAVPFDAGIACVHNDSAINVGYTDHAGVHHAMTSVRLLDQPQGPSDRHGSGQSYAVWMPFQWEQAQRALQPKTGRPADVELVKLADNGKPVGEVS